MKCKHQDGNLSEVMLAFHTRRVDGGVVEGDGINDIGSIRYYRYTCAWCGKAWQFQTLNPDTTKMPKWFAKIAETFV